jgi:hypothetical protein
VPVQAQEQTQPHQQLNNIPHKIFYKVAGKQKPYKNNRANNFKASGDPLES